MNDDVVEHDGEIRAEDAYPNHTQEPASKKEQVCFAGGLLKSFFSPENNPPGVPAQPKNGWDEVSQSTEPSEAAVNIASQIWCKPSTENIPMDTRLAREFALEIDKFIPTIVKGNFAAGDFAFEKDRVEREKVNGLLNPSDKPVIVFMNAVVNKTISSISFSPPDSDTHNNRSYLKFEFTDGTSHYLNREDME